MKKYLLALLVCMLSLGFLKAENFKADFEGVKVTVFSLGKRSAPVDKLVANNDKQKALIDKALKASPQNEHNVMLVRGENFTMLVDTGFESTQELLKDKLKGLGVSFEDITHVFITHAHGDHIGGVLKNGANNFKNARLIIDKNEYDFWLKSENALAKNALLSFGENKEFIEHSKPLFDSKLDIRAIRAYGHTPGHNMLAFSTKSGANSKKANSKNSGASGANGEKNSDKLVFWVDLVHVASVQLEDPAIAIAYDNDKVQAVKTREKFLKEFKKDKVKVLGTHMPSSKPLSLD